MSEERRTKYSGSPERKGRFRHRWKGEPRPAARTDTPSPDDPQFAELRPFVKQRKDDAEHERLRQLERDRERVAQAEDDQARRRLEKEQGEAQRDLDDFWREFHRPSRLARRQWSRAVKKEMRRARIDLASMVALPTYTEPVIDARGEIGVYLSTGYLGAKTTRYGCARRLALYITSPDSVELVDGRAATISNMGDERPEVAAGMALVEDANRAARANGKVVVTFILALPPDLTPAQRLRLLRLWCHINFGVHDLPYVAALHRPPDGGDPRNTHAHVMVSFRPAYRVGDHRWRVARAPRTDLDNPAQFRVMRERFATLMTAVVQEAGMNRVYTPLSYAERGLLHRPTTHLAPHLTREARAGNYVAPSARNARTIAVNEARTAARAADRRVAALQQLTGEVRRDRVRSVRPVVSVPPPVRVARARPVTTPARPAIASLSRALPAVNVAKVKRPRRVIVPTPSPEVTRLSRRVEPPEGGHAGPVAVRRPSAVVIASMRAGTIDRLPPLAETHPPSPAARRLSAEVTPPDQTQRLSSPAVVVSPASQPRVKRLSAPVDLVTDDREVTDVRRLSAAVPSVERSPQVLRPLSPDVDVRGPAAIKRPLPAPTSSPDHVARASAPVRVEAPRLRRPGNVVLTDATDGLQPCLKRPAMVTPIEPVMVRRPSAAVAVRSPSEHVHRPSEVAALPIAPSEVRFTDRALVDRVLAIASAVAQADQAAVTAAAERTAKVARNADAARVLQAEDDARRHRQLIQFLALLALNPHWLERGGEGRLKPGAAMPAKAVAAFGRLEGRGGHRVLIEAVRRGVITGVTDLPDGVASDVAARLAEIAAPELAMRPAPLITLMSGERRYAGEFALALAILAQQPSWISERGGLVTVSPDAPPAATRALARHATDPRAVDQLRALRRAALDGPDLLDPALRRQVDHARDEVNRSAGAAQTIGDDGKPTAAMLDNLVRLRRRRDWVRLHPQLGLRLSEAASPLLRGQWQRWDQPGAARQLVLEALDLARTAFLLPPSLKAEVVARADIAQGRDVHPPAAGRDRGHD